MDLKARPNLIGDMMFSDSSLDRMAEGTPDVNHPWRRTRG